MLSSLAQATATESDELVEEIRLDELLWDVKERVREEHVASDVVMAMDDLPAEPEGLSVHGNRYLLSSAFSNIFENAVKFSDNQRVVCRLRCTPQNLEITVSDTGIG